MKRNPDSDAALIAHVNAWSKAEAKRSGRRVPMVKLDDEASVRRWLKWNDRDGEYDYLDYDMLMDYLRNAFSGDTLNNPKRTTYTVHAKKNGKPIASLHKVHDNLKAAKQDAAALAGMVPGATGVVVRKNGGTAKRRRNPANVDMEKLGYQHAMETNAGDRHDAWAGLTAAQAVEWVAGAADADEIDYPLDKASIAAFRKGVKRALAGTAKRNPARVRRNSGDAPYRAYYGLAEMEDLGDYFVRNDAADYFSGKSFPKEYAVLAKMGSTEAADLLGDLRDFYGDMPYPGNSASVEAFRRGVRTRAAAMAKAAKVSDVGGKRSAGKVDMEKLGYQTAKQTDAAQRSAVWGDLTEDRARREIEAISDRKHVRLPTNWDGVGPFMIGVDRAIEEAAAKRNPANPPREIVYGHVVVHTKAGYAIPAYKRTFPKMADARKWLKGHVQRESAPTANPACRCRKK